MNNISRKGTCIFHIHEVLSKNVDTPVTRKEIIDCIFKVIDWKSLQCVQLMPNHFVRVSFKTEDAKDIFIQRGFSLRNIRITLQDADPRVNFIYIHHLPTEVPDSSLSEYLRSFGKIASVQRQRDRDHPTIETGTRIVRMVVECHLPPRARISSFPCRIWYKEQPKSCRVCLKEGHLAPECPLKGKCLRCGSVDHMARECTRPWGQPPAPPTNAVQPPPSDQPAETPMSVEKSTASKEPSSEPVPRQPTNPPSSPLWTEIAPKPAVPRDAEFRVPVDPAPSDSQDWTTVTRRPRAKRSSKSEPRARSRTPIRDSSPPPPASPASSSVQPDSQPSLQPAVQPSKSGSSDDC